MGSMKMTKINLANNKISDKYMGLFLRMVRKCMPNMVELDLSNNAISNKSLPVIMRNGNLSLKIELSACSGVTLKALSKYQRRHYDDEIPHKYIYCKEMVVFINKDEETSQNAEIAKRAKYTRGKERKLQAYNRKK